MNFVVLLASLADRMGTDWVLRCVDAVVQVKGASLCGEHAHLDPILSRVALAAAVADADGRWWDLLTARDALEAGFLDEDF